MTGNFLWKSLKSCATKNFLSHSRKILSLFYQKSAGKYKNWIEALKMELFVWQIVRVSPPFTGNRVVLQTSGEAMRQILDDYGGMPGARCERCWDFWISGNISFPQSLPTLLMVTWVKNYVFFYFFFDIIWSSALKLRKHVRDILKKLISEHLVGLLVKQVIWPVIL